MAAWRYEISLRVLKNISRVFQHEKRNFVSPSGHVMFYLLYKHQWNTKPFHFNSFFGVKGAIYYEAIATGIFSHVKITCYFHMWRYRQVFARKLAWYFIGVYIIIRFSDSLFHGVNYGSIELRQNRFSFWNPISILFEEPGI